MIYKELIKEDYQRISEKIWLAGKRVTHKRLKFLCSHFGYKHNLNKWCYIYSTKWNSDSAYMFLETDGILLLFTDHGSKNPSTIFTGDYQFIPANQIKGILIKTRLFNKQYELVYGTLNVKLPFKIEDNYFSNFHNNITNTVSFPKFFISQINNYGKYSYSNNIYKHRMTIKHKASKNYITIKVLQDCVSHYESPLEAFKSFWSIRLCSVASKSGLLWCTLLSLILISLSISFPTNLAYLLLAIIYYLLIMESIRRLHDIDLPFELALLMFIPGINIIFIIFLTAKASKHESVQNAKDIINSYYH